jgi:hypothetical protein
MVRRSAGVLSRGPRKGARTRATYQVALGQIRPDEDAPLDALADKGGRRSAQQPLEPHAAQSAWTPPCWRTGPRPAAFAKKATRTVPGDLTAERGDQAPMNGACRRAGQPLVQDGADQSREARLCRRVHPDRTGPGDELAQDRIALGQGVSGRLVAAGRAGGYCRTRHVGLSCLWPVQAFADWAESHSAPGLTRSG